jgi:hypothetical protein
MYFNDSIHGVSVYDSITKITTSMLLLTFISLFHFADLLAVAEPENLSKCPSALALPPALAIYTLRAL